MRIIKECFLPLGIDKEKWGKPISPKNTTANKDGLLRVDAKGRRVSDTRGESWLSFTLEQNKKG